MFFLDVPGLAYSYPADNLSVSDGIQLSVSSGTEGNQPAVLFVASIGIIKHNRLGSIQNYRIRTRLAMTFCIDRIISESCGIRTYIAVFRSDLGRFRFNLLAVFISFLDCARTDTLYWYISVCRSPACPTVPEPVCRPMTTHRSRRHGNRSGVPKPHAHT